MQLRVLGGAFLLLSTAVCSLTVWAGNTVWTGAGDGKSWSDPANWNPTPQSLDTAVFNQSADVEIDACWTNSSGSVIYPKGMTVSAEGVTVRLLKTTLKSTFYIQDSQPVFDIAANSELYSSNTLSYYYFGTFHKRGTGKLRIGAGHELSCEHVWHVDVEAGTLEADGASARITPSNLVVRSGATLSLVNGGRANRGDLVLTLEEGATLYVENTEEARPAALQGAGAVTAGPKGLLEITGAADPAMPFTGTFGDGLRLRFDEPSGTHQKFVLQRADQLSGSVTLERTTGLTFRKGLKEIYLGDVTRPNADSSHTLTLADEEGDPVAVHARLVYSGFLNLAGGGDLYIENPTGDSVTLYQNKCTMTGRIICTNDCELTVGNGSSGVHNFDLSGAGISGLYYRGRSFRLGYCEPNPWPEAKIPIDVGITNGLTLLNSGAKLGRDVRMTTKNLLLSGFGGSRGSPLDVAGAKLYVSNAVNGGIGGELNEHRVMRVSGGVMSKPPVRVAKDPMRTLPQPDFLTFPGSTGWMSFEVTGGQFFWGTGSGPKNVFARGGRAVLTSGTGLSTTATALADGGRAQLVFDGGTVVADTRSSTGDTHDFQSSNNDIVNYVAEKGGWLTTSFNIRDDLDYLHLHINNAFETCTNVVTDGGLNVYVSSSYDFYRPLAINGPFRALDGVLKLRSSQLADATKPPYGTGDFVLQNVMFQPYSESTGFKTQLTMPVPGTLAFGGSVSVASRVNSNYTYLNFDVGALRTDGKGGVLQLRTTDVADLGTAFTFKAQTAPETDPNTHALRLPVLIVSTSGLYTEHFATYDATKGIVAIPAEDYAVNDLTQGANKFVTISSGRTLDADRAIAGARYTVGGQAITIPSGLTLTVGNGTDPAFICFNNTGALNGPGTVDFRGSTGYFRPNNTVGTAPHVISATIAGSNGIAYTGSPDFSYDSKFRIDRAATYTGGTYINCCRVWPTCAGAFSSGDVYVGAGERNGGEIDFHTTHTFANNFHIGGFGYSRLLRYNSYTNIVSGALTFEKGATIAGNVELTHPVGDNRIAVSERVTGTILGTVSGARLGMYNTDGRYSGTLALYGHNTYTGGTDVVRASIAVREADGFGTGKVTMDTGALIFQNTSDITVTNDLEGVGTLKMPGGGAVAFTGDTREADFTLDLDGAAVKLTELPSFVSALVNANGERASLTIPAGASVDLAGIRVGDLSKVELIVEAGATLNLGGDLTVRRLTGDGTITGGTVTELHPKLGFMYLVK